MSEENSELDLILNHEKNGIIVFMGAEGIMGAEIKKFIQQPAEGILYDLNRDKVTLLSQYSRDNVRWINDYAVAVTITALRAEIASLKEVTKGVDLLVKDHQADLARRDEVIARLTIECDAMAEENRVLSERIQRLVDWHVRAEEAGKLRKKARDWERGEGRGNESCC